MYSSINIEHIKKILIRISKGDEVSFKERIFIEQAADKDQTLRSWLTKARRMQQGNYPNNKVDKLLNALDLGSTEPVTINKPDPEELGNWFSGAPSWVARS